MTDIPEKPERSAADAGYAMVRAAVSAIPTVGGIAAEVFSAIVAPPLERRRDRWFEEVAKAVQELQTGAAELTPEKLSQDESFVATLLHATQIASRTHETEKLESLRNAVVSSGLPGAPDDALQQIFLRYVDDFTLWHLRILKFFDDPSGWQKSELNRLQLLSASSPAQMLEKSMPELANRRDFCRQLIDDLQQRGLLVRFDMNGMTTGGGALTPRTANFGKAFLKFISRPA